MLQPLCRYAHPTEWGPCCRRGVLFLRVPFLLFLVSRSKGPTSCFLGSRNMVLLLRSPVSPLRTPLPVYDTGANMPNLEVGTCWWLGVQQPRLGVLTPIPRIMRTAEKLNALFTRTAAQIHFKVIYYYLNTEYKRGVFYSENIFFLRKRTSPQKRSFL